MFCMNAHTAFDPAWLDAQYNNRALVPEHGQILERWARDSAAARQKLRHALIDVAYGHGPGETLDIFPAPFRVDTAPAPVLVFIHGGYWRALDKVSAGALTAAVVKADAYGTGIEMASKALHAAGARFFFVATVDEGMAVRAAVPDAPEKHGVRQQI